MQRSSLSYFNKAMISLFFLSFSFGLLAKDSGFSFAKLSESYPVQRGLIDVMYDSDDDDLYLKVPLDLGEFIYQTSLPAGLGSNDIGLDRGQLSSTRIAYFKIVGNRALLMQTNTAYRANTDNAAERKAINDSFASSILWSFDVKEKLDDSVVIDASGFILQDIHGVVRRLKSRNQGSFKLDKSRSIVALENTKSFPDNTELESWLTFTGSEPGRFVRQAAVNPLVFSVRQRHSFIRLPEPGYEPLAYHPDSGYFDYRFQDYTTPINESTTVRMIPRHRLSKKNPNAEMSEAVEPIIYYVDSGVPEPVKTALIDGARWWNHAYEAIGYKDAYQVKTLPEGADPMDVRYNVIQWVHRATRGWSYGASVIDPRTGEIIKGHVSLGSLRIRQDYLIAQALLAPFENEDATDTQLQELAIARIRQLSAHEVGHTLGLAHNFAASAYDRGSVMDYPHPLIELKDGKIYTNNAYTNDIGIWDKRAIAYGYDDLTDAERAELLRDNREKGYWYISDADSRDLYDAHPVASLWDNGANAVDELNRVVEVRDFALDKFGEANLHFGRVYSDLEEVLVPLYYFHRYQAEAAGKFIGGYHYNYAVKGEQTGTQTAVSGEQQRAARDALLKTLTPDFLMLNESIADIILPKARGYQRDRESINGNTGVILDQEYLAAASAQHTFNILLHSQRLTRLAQQSARDGSIMSPANLIYTMHKQIIGATKGTKGYEQKTNLMVLNLMVSNLLNRFHDNNTPASIKRVIHKGLHGMASALSQDLESISDSDIRHAFGYEMERIEEGLSEDDWEMITLPKMPPGSPI